MLPEISAVMQSSLFHKIIRSSRSIHFVANDKRALILRLENIPSYVLILHIYNICHLSVIYREIKRKYDTDMWYVHEP